MRNGKPGGKPSIPESHRTQADSAEWSPSSEYRHILVPTRLADQDRSAVILGLQLAAANDARVTFLHVLSPAVLSSSVHWLDAIHELHQALARPLGALAIRGGRPVAVVRQEIAEFIERLAPAHLHQAVDVQVECRWGDVAEEITRFARENRADLVLMSHARSGWRLSFRAHLARRVMRNLPQRVLLVYPATQEQPAVPVQSTVRRNSR